jgi:hypothetical protein
MFLIRPFQFDPLYPRSKKDWNRQAEREMKKADCGKIRNPHSAIRNGD